MVSLPKLPPWGIPLIGGLALGWFFSSTIQKGFDTLHLPIKGAHAGKIQAPPHPLTPSATWPRRSFDRSYDSWLHTTVNALPTQG